MVHENPPDGNNVAPSRLDPTENVQRDGRAGHHARGRPLMTLLEASGSAPLLEPTSGRTGPRSSRAAPSGPSPPPPGGPLRESRRFAAALAGLRILIVEDDPDGRELLAAILEGAGAAVLRASSAREGFELLQRSPVHLLVSDIAMPDEDGYSLMRKIRTLAPALGGAVPAIALTAFTADTDRDRSLAAGFARHLGKPVDAIALLDTALALVRGNAS
jgi:CheY-like chemotaxis protein